ncbi:uncharacterized protein DUF445 [Geothermobacter ehrlichii]|uniref:Uncharacterized protein DUF445 n=1 Tax=Geothermobacter ehrlichii TaxID=213224 RepID=A0A5D3WI97_9BACT|nr:DUF445 family protein [Geothermobacter ehrlichii]TYO98161.1 uncharacterized protein DUF445 [Geothermobacter ehrlichii]
MDSNQLIAYLVPPVVGAFIGYLTNSIAIRMLFRPLRPWHLFGVRIPLTPGIIPSRRGELAERLGETVGRHLLTAGDVGRVLARESFQRELRQAVAEKVAGFLGRELGTVESLVPAEFRGRFRDLLEQARGKLVKAVFAWLEGEECRSRLAAWLDRLGDDWLRRDLAGWLGEEGCRELLAHLDARVERLLQSPEVGRALERLVDDQIDRLLTSRQSLRDLLPDDLVEVLLDQLEKEVPGLLEKFGGLLYDPGFRQRLVVRAREGIEGFLDSLQGLAGLLSGFINLDGIYEKLPGFLDQAGDEIAAWLREEQTQQQVARMLRERAEAFLDRPLASYLEKLPYEKVHGIRSYARQQAVALLTGPRTLALARGAVHAGFARIRDRSFGELLQQALPDGRLAAWRRDLPEKLLAVACSAEARRAVDEVLRGQIDELALRRPLGRLSARMPGDVQDELVEGICRVLRELLQREIPPLVEALNISRMVREKVDSLDILQVEGLLLSIMKEQFKYINLFGGLLGFLIGLINLLVLRLG